MGIFKDFNETYGGRPFPYQIKEYFTPYNWRQIFKWRKQRLDRGWSDRDTWGAGDHIAKMTAEMLQHLNDHTYVDWPEWFKLNVKEEGKGAYKNLQSVINDINAYLDLEETSWSDGLTTKRDSVDEIFKKREDNMYEWIGPDWYDGEKKLSDAAVKQRIKAWHKKSNARYKKAQKAMGFFARHFSGFWD